MQSLLADGFSAEVCEAFLRCSKIEVGEKRLTAFMNEARRWLSGLCRTAEECSLFVRFPSQTVSSSLQDDDKGDGPFRKRSKQARQSGTEWWLEDDLEYGSAR